MRRLGLAALILTPALLAVPAAALLRAEPKPATAARKVGDFRLADTSGKVWSLKDLKDSKAVVVVPMPLNSGFCWPLA